MSIEPLSLTFPAKAGRLCDCPTLFTLPLPSDTSLAALVCTYGFYGLPPNVWLPCNADIESIELRRTESTARIGVHYTRLGTVEHGCFIRALRYDDDYSDVVWVAITQEEDSEREEETEDAADEAEPTESTTEAQSDSRSRHQLVVRALQPPVSALVAAREQSTRSLTAVLSSAHVRCLVQQVRRMFNLDRERAYSEFHALMPLAREYGFARLFRSPGLFEDCVKTITLCNSSWTRITHMNDALCTQLGLGGRFRLHLAVHAPPPQRRLLGMTAVNGVKESAQSRRMRGGRVSELTEGQHAGGKRHEVTVGVFPSAAEVAASTVDVLRSRSASHSAHSHPFTVLLCTVVSYSPLECLSCANGLKVSGWLSRHAHTATRPAVRVGASQTSAHTSHQLCSDRAAEWTSHSPLLCCRHIECSWVRPSSRWWTRPLPRLRCIASFCRCMASGRSQPPTR